ncbi:SepM family pheromone-processing serine protease [Bacillus marasmi]|uniref:SepM family pheromone-processing serine protease n=1 Tax=Bacillus marasmi TaxID=1926279 RepID=UPI0011C91B5D|nr:SepM family pheromone-processing serine protease [Bacillus marasmi]
MRKYRSLIFLIIAGLLFVASSFYYLPYYVSKPGMAKELEPIIEVENGYDEEGNFMLTTIRMGKANIYAYAIAKMSKYQEIYPVEAVRSKNESDEEYNVRQLHMMDGSKTNAIEVAYKKANLPINYEFKGVYVLNIIEDMPADGMLKPGDRIIKIDGNRFNSMDKFIDYINGKKAGDKLSVTYERNEKSKTVSIEIAQFPQDKNKVGIGIGLVDDKEIVVEPEVHINTEEIGGPSAGLMFTLEIYNQLTKSDLTRGYQIAGTGTIASDGTVGRIGGIEQKVVAADKAGAEIFLAPNEKGAKDSNYKMAVKTAKDIDTKMKIVPIDNFDDAVQYLEKLKEKK